MIDFLRSAERAYRAWSDHVRETLGYRARALAAEAHVVDLEADVQLARATAARAEYELGVVRAAAGPSEQATATARIEPLYPEERQAAVDALRCWEASGYDHDRHLAAALRKLLRSGGYLDGGAAS